MTKPACRSRRWPARSTWPGRSATYAVYPGGHDWDVWYPRLNQMLILASHDFSTPLPAPRSTTRRRGRAVASALPGGAYAIRCPPWFADATRAVPRIAGPARSHPAQRRVRPVDAAPATPPRPRPDRLALTGALLLALLSAAAINIGFLLQHRALAGQADGSSRALIAMLSNRTWLAGQAVGWVGFAGQLIAVALAPLSLVQAFAAGGLALSLPIAARVFGQRVSREQMVAISVMAVALASLPIALVSHSSLHGGTLLLMSLTVLAIAAVIGDDGRTGRAGDRRGLLVRGGRRRDQGHLYRLARARFRRPASRYGPCWRLSGPSPASWHSSRRCDAAVLSSRSR